MQGLCGRLEQRAYANGMKSHTPAGATISLGLIRSIFRHITGMLVIAQGAVGGVSNKEVTSSPLSHIGNVSGLKKRYFLQFFNLTGAIFARQIR